MTYFSQLALLADDHFRWFGLKRFISQIANGIRPHIAAPAMLLAISLLGACASPPQPAQKEIVVDLKAPFELTGRAPAHWPEWNNQGRIRFHLADWLKSPNESLADQAVVQVTRQNERVMEVQYSYPRAMIDAKAPPINTDQQGVYHYCIAARLAALQGTSHWGAGDAFDDVAMEKDRSVRLLALALDAEHVPYRHLLPEHLRDSIDALEFSKARAVCEAHMRPEFLW
ncbi:hypothetical protein [Hydrogenophaga sp.]|uniref:hypothetical protein n=1 Tax=Hydrogenophaga sp. TaxID=1904254 RepID=UPI00271B43C0|nr:hypothetical protein [Hydrogenophaga sp.]MDO8906029.1 hypothetical protein [Hydrogenophaga sp.]